MKRRLKKIAWCLSVLLLLAIIAIAQINGYAKVNPSFIKRPVIEIDSSAVDYALLKKQFGANKEMPPGYEKQVLCALSYYPELANTKIRFIIKKSKGGIISSQPTAASFFKKASRRTYLVIINDSVAGRTLPTFSKGDFNGQVGVLGHELCHIIYSDNQTGLGLMGLGIRELSNSYLDKEEYRTDSMNVERGLGYQAMAWENYLVKSFTAIYAQNSMPFKPIFSGKRYMDVEDIKRVMAKSELYKGIIQ